MSSISFSLPLQMHSWSDSWNEGKQLSHSPFGHVLQPIGHCMHPSPLNQNPILLSHAEISSHTGAKLVSASLPLSVIVASRKHLWDWQRPQSNIELIFFDLLSHYGVSRLPLNIVCFTTSVVFDFRPTTSTCELSSTEPLSHNPMLSSKGIALSPFYLRSS